MIKISCKYIVLATLFLILTKTTDCCPLSVDKIKEAVERQLRDYPKSTLQDLYKSFFQDRFGPGHLVNDTASAGRYLRYELNNAESSHENYYEPTGCDTNYYRVNLSVLKKNKVTYHQFFDAFLRSVKNVNLDDISEWKDEWAFIESVIISMNLNLENFDDDLEMIHSILEQGEYAVHHSEIYNSEYHPHYRIIEKKIFEEEILPLIRN